MEGAWTASRGATPLADALVKLAALDEPPVRFAAGADAVATFEQKASQLAAQADAHRELFTSLAHDDAQFDPRPSRAAAASQDSKYVCPGLLWVDRRDLERVRSGR